ncbi:MAG: ferritin [Thaumarchaeota archaeon]|nr:ferritin [Nitrososphaerota archaeon]
MSSKEFLEKLNKAIARELQVSIQYMWQHVSWKHPKKEIRDELKKIAIVEMRHAEDIAERLVELGGTPTTKPEEIKVGEEPAEMIERDVRDEEGAIKLYTEIIEDAEKLGDEATANLFKKILEEEKKHREYFMKALKQL